MALDLLRLVKIHFFIKVKQSENIQLTSSVSVLYFDSAVNKIDICFLTCQLEFLKRVCESKPEQRTLYVRVNPKNSSSLTEMLKSFR